MLRFHAEQQREQESRGDHAAAEGATDGRVNNSRAGKPNSGMFLDNYTRKSTLYAALLTMLMFESDFTRRVASGTAPQGPWHQRYSDFQSRRPDHVQVFRIALSSVPTIHKYLYTFSLSLVHGCV